MRSVIKRAARKIYRLLPFSADHKLRIKLFIYRHFSFLLRPFFPGEVQQNLRHGRPASLPVTANQSGIQGPLKIAVHLHLFYFDLAPEFAAYLKNIPQPFDLFISVGRDQDEEKVKKAFCSVRMAQNIIVRQTENRGRDYAPLFVTFREEILTHNILLHIHSKKSLWRGGDSGWRTYMLRSLLGSPQKVADILYMFVHSPAMGTIYPETMDSPHLPYWGHTACQNYPQLKSLFNRMGLPMEDRYIDFPVGSMFWCSVASLKPFYDLRLTFDDFDPEEAQLDGTLAHAIERGIVEAGKETGYHFCTVTDAGTAAAGGLKYDVAFKNLHNYIFRRPEHILEQMKPYTTITFDIFDTLITRCLFSPDDLFRLMEEAFNRKHGTSHPIFRWRKEAESQVWEKRGAVTDLYDIYQELPAVCPLTEQQARELLELEIAYELKLCIPRRDVLDIFNALKQDPSKKIRLISDMYLPGPVVERLLLSCGYSGYDELLISCEKGLRKDIGDLWDWFLQQYKPTEILHVGDSELSDIIRVSQRGYHYLHLMQGRKMLSLTLLYPQIRAYSPSVLESVCMGLWFNKEKYNSPFYLSHQNWNHFSIQSWHELGYIVYGVIVLRFCRWLQQQAKKTDILLFIAREGYHLTALYRHYLDCFALQSPPFHYYLTSRRAAGVSSIRSAADIEALLASPFQGPLRLLFQQRLGISIKNEKEISLPDEKKAVLEVAHQHEGEILKNAQSEREALQAYNNRLEGLSDQSRIGLVDIGYAGSTQHALGKIMPQEMHGLYLSLGENVKKMPANHTVSSCLEPHQPGKKENYIVRMGILLERFLTAPHGQVLCFKQEQTGGVSPVYSSKQPDTCTIEQNRQIAAGVRDFISDLSAVIDSETLMEGTLSDEFVQLLYKNMVFQKDLISDDLKECFVLDDEYAKNASSDNIFEILQSYF